MKVIKDFFDYLRWKREKDPCKVCIVQAICAETCPSKFYYWGCASRIIEYERPFKERFWYYKNNPQVIGDKLLYILFLLSVTAFYGTIGYVIVQLIRIAFRN
jgi:hypothetical protein